MLQNALMMSMDSSAGGAAPATAGGADADLGAMTEEEQIAYAIQMSMADSAPAAEAESMEDDSQLVTDPAFLQSVLQNLPGVDPNSDAVKEALKKEDEDQEKDQSK